MTATAAAPPSHRWQRFSAAAVRGFHSYANWLVGITWKRFVLLSVLLMIVSGVLQNVPPFSWSYTRVVQLPVADMPAPLPPEAPRKREINIGKPGAPAQSDGVEIVIDTSLGQQVEAGVVGGE